MAEIRSAKPKRTTSRVGRQEVAPQYAIFPKPISQDDSQDPNSPENISKRQQVELGEVEETKAKEVKTDRDPKRFRAMTGSRIIPGGDTGALSVLASLYDSPVIRMFMAASQPRRK